METRVEEKKICCYNMPHMLHNKYAYIMTEKEIKRNGLIYFISSYHQHKHHPPFPTFFYNIWKMWARSLTIVMHWECCAVSECCWWWCDTWADTRKDEDKSSTTRRIVNVVKPTKNKKRNHFLPFSFLLFTTKPQKKDPPKAIYFCCKCKILSTFPCIFSILSKYGPLLITIIVLWMWVQKYGMICIYVALL